MNSFEESELETESAEWHLGEHLRDVFGNAGEIRSQTLDAVEQRLRAGSVLGTLADLVGVGFETASVLLNDRSGAAEREREGK